MLNNNEIVIDVQGTIYSLFQKENYCERRDADFDNKMHNVLLVYNYVKEK